MYGRETPVGYQKSIVTGSVSPACWSSCFALFGSYGYFTTRGDQPNSCGGWDCVAPRPAPTVERVHARLPVETVCNGITHGQVVRRRLRQVHTDVRNVERRPA